MGAVVMGPDGQEVPVEMGSYGIGVSRLVGALIEAFHDEAGIKWPEPVAPFGLGLINLRPSDPACSALCERLERELARAGIEVLHDDSEESAGAKFAAMDLIGLPWQVIVGPRGAKQGTLELKRRADGSREELSPEALLSRMTA
jgi:prolyl-tRNA synthetase